MRVNPTPKVAIAFAALALGCFTTAVAAGSWCLGFGSLGPVRTGMTVEQVLRLADWPGLERKQPAGDCWYMKYRAGGADFDLMIIGDRVARIELTGQSRLGTFSGARLGMAEAALEKLYGRALDSQPHKYDPDGRTLTYRSSDGALGLRFETAQGKVTAIQSGSWEHLHYVEGCG